MDAMMKISKDFCEDCYLGRKFEGEEICRCIKNDENSCPYKEEIEKIEKKALH